MSLLDHLWKTKYCILNQKLSSSNINKYEQGTVSRDISVEKNVDLGILSKSYPILKRNLKV